MIDWKEKNSDHWHGSVKGSKSFYSVERPGPSGRWALKFYKGGASSSDAIATGFDADKLKKRAEFLETMLGESLSARLGRLIEGSKKAGLTKAQWDAVLRSTSDAYRSSDARMVDDLMAGFQKVSKKYGLGDYFDGAVFQLVAEKARRSGRWQDSDYAELDDARRQDAGD